MKLGFSTTRLRQETRLDNLNCDTWHKDKIEAWRFHVNLGYQFTYMYVTTSITVASDVLLFLSGSHSLGFCNR